MKLDKDSAFVCHCLSTISMAGAFWSVMANNLDALIFCGLCALYFAHWAKA